jgi:hypothetical protein
MRLSSFDTLLNTTARPILSTVLLLLWTLMPSLLSIFCFSMTFVKRKRCAHDRWIYRSCTGPSTSQVHRWYHRSCILYHRSIATLGCTDPLSNLSILPAAGPSHIAHCKSANEPKRSFLRRGSINIMNISILGRSTWPHGNRYYAFEQTPYLDSCSLGKLHWSRHLVAS